MSEKPRTNGLQAVAERLDLKKNVLAFLRKTERKGLVEVAPVHWPNKDLEGDCNHYSWPLRP